MSIRLKPPRRRLAQCAAGALLALVAFAVPAAAQYPPAPQPPLAAPASGTARVWFYRVFFPGDTQTMPAVRLNGRIVGYARPGIRFYRDVPAGNYHVSVDTVGRDVNQAKDVTLVPGEELYLAIQSAPDWDTAGRFGYRRPTYYVAQLVPRLTAAEIAETRPGTGE